jgi:hypothetical protein
MMNDQMSAERKVLQKMQVIEEECQHFLETYVSELSEERAVRRGQAICSAFQKLLVVGHEHCNHELNCQVLEMPAEELQHFEVPRGMERKLKFHLFMDYTKGFEVAIHRVEDPTVELRAAMGVLPKHPTTYQEILDHGIKPRQLVEGFLRIVHQNAAQMMATQGEASA